MKSNPNRHNLSLWATTISLTRPVRTRSIMEINPLRLKLMPDPMSLTTSWSGNLADRYAICRWRSSLCFGDETRTYTILLLLSVADALLIDLSVPTSIRTEPDGVNVGFILPASIHLLIVIGFT